jgi:sigma-B regulation protein RsbU (phosphoserine phosphatase)
MGKFTLIVAVLWILGLFFFTPALRASSPVLSLLLDLLTLLFTAALVFYVWKLSRYLRNRLLWKIRRRLIVAHIFIGAIPILLVIGIFLVSAGLIYYQLSYYLITNQIGIHSAQVHAFSLSLRDGLQERMLTASPRSLAALKSGLDADSKYLLGAYPSASIILRFTDPATNTGSTYVNQSTVSERLKEYQIPRWLGDREFSGLVLEDLQPQIYSGRLFLRSFVSSDFRADIPFTLEVSVPLDRYLIGRLKAALGQDFLIARGVADRGMNVLRQNAETLRDNIVDSTLDPEDKNVFASPVWSILLFPTSWSSGMETTSDADVLLVELSTSKLMQNVFRSESTAENTVGKIILGVLKTIVVFFLIVEIISMVIGIVLTKSITSAVYNLDRGTEFVKRGDFSQRIVVHSQDQLGALAASFNQMTEYVQQLVRERVERERLERELEIAKEVQERLFPGSPPQVGRLNVSGICLPARIVSGDYYDFLPLGDSELGLAVGDICGKGISAALLMSNLQATLRSNVLNLLRQHSVNGEKAVSEVVRKLNSQIYNFTSANKFATFFYAVYDDAHQTLTYCNAGHNPPLYFNGSGVRRLCAGGTVVGVFADSQYDQETIHVNSGDIFLAYTDGIVESVNEYGEEFGESRLTQLIEESRNLDAEKIKETVVDRVLSWTYAGEREDDMTLIVAKIVDPSHVS